MLLPSSDLHLSKKAGDQKVHNREAKRADFQSCLVEQRGDVDVPALPARPLEFSGYWGTSKWPEEPMKDKLRESISLTVILNSL